MGVKNILCINNYSSTKQDIILIYVYCTREHVKRCFVGDYVQEVLQWLLIENVKKKQDRYMGTHIYISGERERKREREREREIHV